MRHAISSNYVVYLQIYDIDIGVEDDPITFSQAMGGSESTLWYNSMKDEMNSMANNQVWDLVELPKGFTQQEGIDYHDTFSLVSKKYSFWIIMALVAHFDIELHQMDVKTTFLNGDLEEEVYRKQPEEFITNGNDHIVCKLKKSIYGLKQASRQWYLKFHDVISSFGFIENVMDQCIYHKVKRFLSQQFDMKDMGEASYVIGIKIERDRSQWILGLSQETYINKMLERFCMKDCSPDIAPIVKGDRFSLNQCPSNDLEKKEMKNIPYAFAVGSLMYAQPEGHFMEKCKANTGCYFDNKT
ncbi:Retrovirus-related Pol polyprotein from transposon TNT 1-94 [Vitis vinifera]|uniref:Retrovirus-related Pol polyprotein from transposon TNT 1-94 n=1 Tax=Vitis vinifera TaxID=29760 RepID=A0A438CH33_VITVI|nr:Retrovirus-related Pol polyprotein from transposon TNT 1-94 [Vitis vinifera]